MPDIIPLHTLIDFGDLPDAINLLLQDGVVAYRTDPERAERLFYKALTASPASLPVYYCIYKIHTRARRFEAAYDIVLSGLTEAAQQAGLPQDWRQWTPTMPGNMETGPGRFALYSLKILAFVELRRGHSLMAGELLAALQRLDPHDGIGGSVVAALAAGHTATLE